MPNPTGKDINELTDDEVLALGEWIANCPNKMFHNIILNLEMCALESSMQINPASAGLTHIHADRQMGQAQGYRAILDLIERINLRSKEIVDTKLNRIQTLES